MDVLPGNEVSISLTSNEESGPFSSSSHDFPKSKAHRLSSSKEQRLSSCGRKLKESSFPDTSSEVT